MTTLQGKIYRKEIALGLEIVIFAGYVLGIRFDAVEFTMAR